MLEMTMQNLTVERKQERIYYILKSSSMTVFSDLIKKVDDCEIDSSLVSALSFSG